MWQLINNIYRGKKKIIKKEINKSEQEKAFRFPWLRLRLKVVETTLWVVNHIFFTLRCNDWSDFSLFFLLHINTIYLPAIFYLPLFVYRPILTKVLLALFLYQCQQDKVRPRGCHQSFLWREVLLHPCVKLPGFDFRVQENLSSWKAPVMPPWVRLIPIRHFGHIT